MKIESDSYLQKAEKALDYLADSEAEYSSLKARHQAEKERIKIVEASGTLESQQKSIKLKEMDSKASQDYAKAINLWESTLERFYEIEAKRKRAELTIEMYRSVNSALKRGNI
jgi:hypothetical protein